jgi:Flp pilus assembly protein TadB
LPVLFGLRRGVAVGRVEIVRLGDERSRLVWALEESHLEVHKSAVAVLSFAAVPLVATVAWPFHPPLMALLPFAAVAGLAAWWLVVSRLRSRGPHEFFEAIRAAPARGESPSDQIR